MAQGTGVITEIRLETGGLGGRITCPPGLRPVPGQYLVASSLGSIDPLPIALFPSAIENGTLCIAPPLPASWLAGLELSLRGPLGNGFNMPAGARRIALASLDSAPARLIPLANQALAQRAAVTIYSDSTPQGLPAEVEVLPLDLLPEAPAWADFLALDCPLPNLEHIRPKLGLNPFQRPACQTQVLVVTKMPCSGLAECGVCAVATRDGWSLACVDGPVFDYNQLEGV